MKTWIASAVAVATVLLLAGCASMSTTVTASYDEPEVTVPKGGKLIIDFGEVNSSVGSNWVIISDPDPEVLSNPEKHTKYMGEKGSVGGPDHLTHTAQAIEVGTTRIQFEYQFRGEVPQDPTEQEISIIDVTVY